MKRLGFVLGCLICVLALAGPARADVGHAEEIDAPSGGELSVRLETGGEIEIVGWDRDVVSVDASFRGRDADNVSFEVQKTSGGVRIVSKFKERRRRNSVDGRVKLRVPDRFDLDLNTMGGKIEIRSVEGDIRGETMGGELRLESLRGDVDLETMGGNIRLRDSEVDGEITSMGGNVELSDVCGSVEATTMGGNVVYDNVTDACGGQCREVRISTMGGNIESPDAPCGADLETMGGNIAIDSAQEYVKAETMGGNIRIGAVDGWVHATTMGGTIRVTMVGDPRSGRRDVRLDSKGGDVELGLPEGLSAEIDVTLAYTKRSNKKYSIESDFPLSVRQSESWDHKSGDPRKYIFGRGSVDGGEHKIKIETINGDVRIFKTGSRSR